MNVQNEKPPTLTTDDDVSALVERYLGIYLSWAAKQGPNTAVADNMRRAAVALVVAAIEKGRERYWETREEVRRQMREVTRAGS